MHSQAQGGAVSFAHVAPPLFTPPLFARIAADMAERQRGPARCDRPHGSGGDDAPGYGEDDAPEEVAFEQARSAALERMEDALEAAERARELLKDQRRRRHLLFQKQKEKRLLPQALLEELETLPRKQLRPSGEKAKCLLTPCEDDEDKEEKPEVKKTVKVSKSLQGNCSVMRLKDRSSVSSLQQSAMDFVHTRLYGPGTQRTTTAQALSLEKKRGTNQGAAVQFVNKNWGAEQKAKAGKSNKRFVQKQKLIPS